MYDYYKTFHKGLPKEESKPFFLALERGPEEIKTFKTVIYADGRKENLYYAERLVKTMLWAFGGYKLYLYGDTALYEQIKKIYSDGGERSFDKNFMEKVYIHPFETVNVTDITSFPADCAKGQRAILKAEGRRIGFDAGGSDRKVTACLNDKVIYENETIWHPKLHSDIEYHIEGIEDSIEMALHKLGGKADAIGVSTAGIVIDNELRVSSLFRKVSEEVYAEKVYPVYKNLAAKYGCPVKVANDGDVAALAGAVRLKQGRVMGTAMGTSLAGGYIGGDFEIVGYLNEFAFIPVDSASNAPVDEWSGDKGTGVMYHSQDAAIRLAELLGIVLEDCNSPAEKLKFIQKLIKKDDPRAYSIYETLGLYYAETLLWLSLFYDFDKVMLLGRVASGKGGDIMLKTASAHLKEENSALTIVLPDEDERRLGQSYVAAIM